MANKVTRRRAFAAALVLFLLALPFAQTPGQSLKDLLEGALNELTGAKKGVYITDATILAKSSESVTIRVNYAGIPDPSSLKLSVQLLDIKLKNQPGFIAGTRDLSGATGQADVPIGYSGPPDSLVTAFFKVVLLDRNTGVTVDAVRIDEPHYWKAGGTWSDSNQATDSTPKAITIDPVPLGNTPKGAGPAVPPGGGSYFGGPAPSLAGTWNSNIGVVYEITQSGRNFEWLDTKSNIKGQSMILGQGQLQTTYVFPPGKTNHAKGTLVQDAQGGVTEIRWNNGIVFKRSSATAAKAAPFQVRKIDQTSMEATQPTSVPIADLLGKLQLIPEVSLSGLLDKDLKLISRHSGLCMDLAGFNRADGANIQQWECQSTWNKGLNQQWKIKALGGEYYKIVSSGTGKCVEVAGVYAVHGANIHQSTCSGDASQRWMLTPVGGGYYKIVSRLAGKVLAVANSSMKNRGNVQLSDDVNGGNQQWKPVPAEQAP